MRIRKETDCAIKMILYLSQTNRVTAVREISEMMSVPKKTLVIAAEKLKETGMVAVHKGIKGGYTLSRRPEEISLLEIKKATEGKQREHLCAKGERYCQIIPAEKCPIYQVFDTIRKNIWQAFATTTIKDLLDNERKTDKHG